jgi:hypothetical protein
MLDDVTLVMAGSLGAVGMAVADEPNTRHPGERTGPVVSNPKSPESRPGEDRRPKDRRQ